MFAINLMFAGLEHLIWHWGIGIGAIILLVLAAEMTTAVPLIGPWLEKVRKDLLWVAVAIALVLAGEFVGAKDMADRCDAKAAVVTTEVHTQVVKARKPAAPGVREPGETDE